jgi:hypothetical protein
MRWKHLKRLRVLDFDIENRPLSYLGGDWTTADITAIAAGWLDSDEIDCRVLTKRQESGRQMLAWFRSLWDEADMVTGHYIRKHDLPIINGALMEHKLPLLTPKLTSDTKLDLVRRKDLSASQEALGGMYGIDAPKEHMGQHHWREANRLTPHGIEETRRRVVGDVRQHKLLRARLIEAGALKEPKVWRP